MIIGVVLRFRRGSKSGILHAYRDLGLGEALDWLSLVLASSCESLQGVELVMVQADRIG